MPDDLRPGVLVEVGVGLSLAEDPPCASGGVEGPEVAGGDPPSGLIGVAAACPLVQLSPQVIVQSLEGCLGRPGPVVVGLALDDRVEGSDHLDRVGAAQGAQLVGVTLPDSFQRGAAGVGADLV